jgi:glycerol uptake facilitator protein
MSATQPAARGGWNARFGPTAAWRRTVWGEVLGEFLGTFVLIMFGVGSVAMTVAALNQSGRGPAPFVTQADWLIIIFGWGFGVTFGVYVAGGLTGAHLNPAVTLALATYRGFAWRKVPYYIVAQVAGAFVAAAVVYGNYNAAIDSFERARGIVRGAANSVPTFSIFATFPARYFGSWPGPVIDEVIGTGLLVMLIFALIDTMNQPPRANLAPIAVGFIVMVIGISFGGNSGYAINPARDLGPRLWAWIEGYGKIAVPGDYGNINSYMWIPIVAPIVGALIGGWLYDFFVGDALRARGEPPTPGVEPRGRTVEDFE